MCKSKDTETKSFNVIQCKNYIYISDSKNDYYSSISSLLFDGNKAEQTYKEKWYKLNEIPTKVEKKLSDKQINVHYELKEGYSPSEMMPKNISLDSLNESEYEEVSGLYERKYDTVDGGYESIAFEINIIYKKDDLKWINQNYATKHALIDEIEYHPDLLQEAPCSVTCEEMFDIIRNYVKANINPLVASVTSDYDFHFEVTRKIMISEPYSYDVDINKSSKRRKPNWVKKLVDSKNETVLNIRRKSNDTSYGSNCILAPTMFGKSYTDLENKINTYLVQLIKEINKQYKECSHCQGWGVVEVESNE